MNYSTILKSAITPPLLNTFLKVLDWLKKKLSWSQHQLSLTHTQSLAIRRYKYHYLRQQGFTSKQAGKARDWSWAKIQQFRYQHHLHAVP